MFGFTNENLDNIPDKGLSPHWSTPKINVTLSDVIKCIKTLNLKKACRPNKMPILELQETASEIFPILLRIFQQSLAGVVGWCDGAG